jgi:hypothetical protein
MTARPVTARPENATPVSERCVTSYPCMRLIRGYMEAFGLDKAELRTVCTENPARIAGLDL